MHYVVIPRRVWEGPDGRLALEQNPPPGFFLVQVGFTVLNPYTGKTRGSFVTEQEAQAFANQLGRPTP